MWKNIRPTGAACGSSRSAAIPGLNRRVRASPSCCSAETGGCRPATYYAGFQGRADKIKNDFLGFLLEAWRGGKSVAAYGAAAKGNTLMNYAGIRRDLVSFVVDRNPAKQGKYLPGSRIPIVDEQRLRESKPEYVVILPWNLTAEIVRQLEYIRGWGGKFVTTVPRLEIAQ